MVATSNKSVPVAWPLISSRSAVKYLESFARTLLASKMLHELPSGKLTVCYCWFSHWKWWFSIAMLNYQRVMYMEFWYLFCVEVKWVGDWHIEQVMLLILLSFFLCWNLENGWNLWTCPNRILCLSGSNIPGENCIDAAIDTINQSFHARPLGR